MKLRLWALVICAAFCIGATPRHAHHAPNRPHPLTANAINQAMFAGNDNAALIIKTEVLLARVGFSPGAIDGRDGENFRKALAAFEVQAPHWPFVCAPDAHNQAGAALATYGALWIARRNRLLC